MRAKHVSTRENRLMRGDATRVSCLRPRLTPPREKDLGEILNEVERRHHHNNFVNVSGVV